MKERSEHHSEEGNGLRLYLRLLSYVKRQWPLFLISVAGFALYASTQAGFAKWMETVVQAIEKGGLENRGWLALSVLGLFVVRGTGTFLGNYFITRIARTLVHELRLELFQKLQRLPSAFYHKHSSGTLLAKLTYNVEQVTGAATNAVKVVIQEGLTVIGLFIYMVYLNWKLTLIFLVVGPLIGLLVSYVSKRFRRLSKQLQDSMGSVTNSASEAIKGYQVVRTFGGESFEIDRFNRVSLKNRDQFMKLMITQALSTPVVQFLVACALAALMYFAMEPEIMATMNTGEFIAFITAAGMLTKPLRQLTDVNSVIQKGIAAAQSVFETMDEPAEQDTGSRTLSRANGALELSNLTFRYPGTDRDVLKQIELTIEPGQHVALVGRSGSGKSTLAGLLPRFFDTEKPEQILLDGHPLQEYKLNDLRDQIALVNQQVILFNGTIAENIAYGALSSRTREEVEAAAKAAHVMEFADQLPDGLNTMVGENGVLLSGGQRQRIAIARAILKDAPILIMDEATSALDTESERHIQSAMERVMEGRTTLVIAHRLSTIEHADLIVVMDQGRIVEQGSHKALMDKGGAYAQLHNLQFDDEA
jgi:subfamily B ATP-binding cassette protein MsbA